MTNFLETFLLSVLLSFSAYGQSANAPELEEVMRLLRENLPGASEAELSRVAAEGLIKELAPRVQWVATNSVASEPDRPAILKSEIYNGSFGYLRVGSVQSGLADTFRKSYARLTSSNKLTGLVIDLRYSGGGDYQEAARVADLFVPAGQPLLKIGEQQVASTDEPENLSVPVTVLVNSETRRAAEALAGMLREAGAGLIIGQRTAGEARLFETFTLSNGQKLRIGKIPVQVGGSEALPDNGLAPDLAVNTTPAEEAAFYADPYAAIPRGLPPGDTNQVASATNRVLPRMNEAELVRRHRQGLGIDLGLSEELAGETPRPVIMDPALARALDFLKGVTVLQPYKPL